MNILLDTSYFLPLVKIKVEKWNNKALKEFLNQKDYHIYYSDVTILEMAAKSAKIRLTNAELSFQDTQKGIDALLYDSRITSIPWYNSPQILDFAFQLREIHQDFFDCLIFATALIKMDILGTYDESFVKKIRKTDPILDIVKKINPNFKFWLWDFTEPPFLII